MSAPGATAESATDLALSRRALRGDHAAFEELFRLHEQGLVNVAYRMTGSREDAADIAQEAFLRVFARLDRLADAGDVNLGAYLYRTARNLVYDHSGRSGREVLQDDLERTAGADPAGDADPATAGLVEAQVAEVRAANARLPERHRLVLALRELEGMGYEEIGAVLDMTPAAVGQLLVRARLALRRELRLEQVDVEALDPAVRARLGDIAAYVDGQLDPDRAQVLERLLAENEDARRIKSRFEEVGERYRMWLPLPLLGLAPAVAKAAEDRGLLPRAGAGRARGVPSGRWPGRRTRNAAIGIGVAIVVLATATVTAVVQTPSADADAPAAAPSPATTAPAGTTTTAAASASTAGGLQTTPSAATAPAADPGVPAGGAAGSGGGTATPAAPGSETAAGREPSATTAPARTGGAATPGTTAAADPVPAGDAEPVAPADTPVAEPPADTTPTRTRPTRTRPDRNPGSSVPPAGQSPSDPGTQTDPGTPADTGPTDPGPTGPGPNDPPAGGTPGTGTPDPPGGTPGTSTTPKTPPGGVTIRIPPTATVPGRTPPQVVAK